VGFRVIRWLCELVYVPLVTFRTGSNGANGGFAPWLCEGSDWLCFLQTLGSPLRETPEGAITIDEIQEFMGKW